MAEYLTGKALEEHYKKLGQGTKGGKMKPEGELGFHASMMGSEYPRWQMLYDAVNAMVENKGYSLDEALKHYKLSRWQYEEYAKKVKNGKGVD